MQTLMHIVRYTVNKLEKETSGKKSGILALYKPAGITSHDLVDQVRKKLSMQKIGHAGALDPFATGVMIILVGKATKLSHTILNEDKEYQFDMLLGVRTDTQDPEGNITNIIPKHIPVSKTGVEKVLQNFKGAYFQQVPLFSSVKVGGIRLRELAYTASEIEKEYRDNAWYVRLAFKDTIQNRKLIKYLKGKKEISFILPGRTVEIKKISLRNVTSIPASKISFIQKRSVPNVEYPLLSIKAVVSKGTYIRQLVEDIGMKLGKTPACLMSLERTRIGRISLKQTISLEDIGPI